MAQHRELDAQTVISDLMLVVVSVVPLALLLVRANDNQGAREPLIAQPVSAVPGWQELM